MTSKDADNDMNRSTALSRIYLLHHFPIIKPITRSREGYFVYQGIPRVMRKITQVLSKYSDCEIVVTTSQAQAYSTRQYFNNLGKKNRNRVRILVIDPVPIKKSSIKKKSLTKSLIIKILHFLQYYVVPTGYWSIIIKIKSFNISYFLQHYVVPIGYWPIIIKIIKFIRYIPLRLALYHHKIRKIFKLSKHDSAKMTYVFNYLYSRIPAYIQQINDDAVCSKVIIPHYYSFPESLFIQKDIYLYLPDYIPHFFHGTNEFKEEGICTQIGKEITQKAKIIFCNSHFTKNYLPKSRLEIDKDKIKVFYLPNLNILSKAHSKNFALPNDLKKNGYLFYPTQIRPNKNIPFLFKIFDQLIQRGHDLKLVLTGSPRFNQKAFKVFQLLPSKDRIVFKEGISDNILRTLYKNAALLCFTSLAEGNFPPQIQEALVYDTPIVAPNLGFITERIPKHLNGSLKLCESNNLMQFVEACKQALRNREDFISSQKKLYAYIKKEEKSFDSSILEIFR